MSLSNAIAVRVVSATDIVPDFTRFRRIFERERQMRRWRQRWQQSFDALISMECSRPTAALRSAIEEVLSNAPHRGSPGTFTAEQVAQIIAIACEPPENSGRPIDYWTGREIAEEAWRRPISTKRDSHPKTWKEKWVAKQQFRKV